MARPGPDGPPLGFLLSAVGFGAAQRFRSVIEPFGLDPRQFAVLRAVASDEGVSQQACGASLRVQPSRMVALVDELEDRGLIERRVNPTDRRARALHVTPAGRRILARAFEAVGRNEAAVFAALGEADRAELRRLLYSVAASLGLPPGVHPGMGIE